MANFWINEKYPELAFFKALHEKVDTSRIPTTVYVGYFPPLKSQKCIARYACSYIASLEHVLDNDHHITQQKLLTFACDSFDHAKRVVASASRRR
jgi:hypothetical protein